jgi:hypothetical protein
MHKMKLPAMWDFAKHRFEECCFSGSVGADYGGEFAAVDVQIEILEDLVAPDGNPEIGQARAASATWRRRYF